MYDVRNLKMLANTSTNPLTVLPPRNFFMAHISSTYSRKELNITHAAKLSIIIVVLIYLDGNEAKCKQ